MLHERFGNGGVTDFLEDPNESDFIHTESSSLFRRKRSEDADLCERPPEIGHSCVSGFPAGPYRIGGAAVGEEVPDGVAEHVVFVGEFKSHDYPRLGSPSTRSAMMLRWISLVPA